MLNHLECLRELSTFAINGEAVFLSVTSRPTKDSIPVRSVRGVNVEVMQRPVGAEVINNLSEVTWHEVRFRQYILIY
jgi:hypothetical protein